MWKPANGYDMIEAWDLEWKIRTLRKYGSKGRAEKLYEDYKEKIEWAIKHPRKNPLSI